MSELNIEKATFAGGCFWCMEGPFEKFPGVIEAIAGYCGGDVKNPTYEQVCQGQTGHFESVQIVYDADVMTYEELLNIFWQQIDPTDPGGQFGDRGHHYQTAVFYHDQEQLSLAKESKLELEASKVFDKPIVTELLPFKKFWAAEGYHQGYYKTNAEHYSQYRFFSGRESFLNQAWQGRTCSLIKNK